jgi:hypothetical protein
MWAMEVPARASEAAATLAGLFEQDARLAELQNDAQHRLQGAAQRLWSGLHPDAVGRLYDDTHRGGIGDQSSVRSEVAAVIVDQLRDGGGEPELTTVVLAVVQEIRWAIHRAFVDYRTASEERRQLAATVGELTRELVEVLTDAGWSEHDARNANVHELANPARNR